jgi:HK97 family phage prohead protease
MDITTKATTGRFNAVIKSTTMDTKAPFGSFEAILSVPTEDRDGEVVDARCFEPLPDHITIDVDHAMTVEKTVASGRPFYDGDVLKFAGTYASHPLAQMTRSLVDEGHIRTMSVAYMSARYEIDEKDGLPHLRSAELLNAGIVGIPSNREALITASKSLSANGALDARHGKAVVGSYEDRSERLRQALRGAYPLAEWVWVRATFDDSVVFDIETATGSGTYQAAYTVTDDGVTLADAVEVDLAEVIVAPFKSHTETSTETTPETKTAAAPAAVDSPAAVDVAQANQHRIRALEAELALLP